MKKTKTRDRLVYAVQKRLQTINEASSGYKSFG